MPAPSYQRKNLVIARGSTRAGELQIRDLQRDLRRLGYLGGGIDGNFGRMSERAVMALQYDLLHNDGRSRQSDGDAAVRVLSYNRRRVFDVTGTVDWGMAGCIADMVADPAFPCLPFADDAVSENKKVRRILDELPPPGVPIPFLMAMLMQESGLRHYSEPGRKDEDNFITIGLDTNASQKYIITSRGYGVGQYTLFHHPPRQVEVDEFMTKVKKNIQKAVWEFRYKFDHFVNGSESATQADDRLVEVGAGPLRPCRYGETDPLYMRNCRICLEEAGRRTIREGDRVYANSKIRMVPTDYYAEATYADVPMRKNIPCDWPYAARRYNGAGINSYHYQTIVLINVMNL